jgi:TPR repeat protein
MPWLILLLLAPGLWAQQRMYFDANLATARQLEAKGNSVEAEKEYRLAVWRARNHLEEQDVADALYSLGQFYRHTGRPPDAITALLESLVLQQKLSGDTDVRTGRRLAELAAAFLVNRELAEARPLVERLRVIAPKFQGKEKAFVDGLFAEMDKISQATETFKEISAAAEKGDRHARRALAGCFEDGIGVAPDSKRAFELFSALAAEGDLDSEYYVGVMYDKARGVPRDAAKAAGYFRKAAERGMAVAQFNYAVLLSRGDGVDRNLTEALDWARKAAQGGYPSAAQAVIIIERDLAEEKKKEKARSR